MKIVTSEVMREIDRQTIDGGYVEGKVLMERAGRGATEELLKFTNLLDRNHVKRFTILCGKGNNGGDGYVIAKALVELNYKVALYSVCEVSELQGEALYHARFLPDTVDFQLASNLESFQRGDIIVDCLLGTGLKSDLREPYLSLVNLVNASQYPVIAVDIPSGLNGNTGDVHGVSIVADLTLTIGLPKIGIFRNHGHEFTGRLKCIDIGFPDEIIKQHQGEGNLLVPAEVSRLFLRRPHGTHKYRCGNVGVVGGSFKYGGAAILASRAAARAGAGMVSVIYPDSISAKGPDSLIKIPVPSFKGHFCDESIGECFDALQKVDTVVLGPGLTGDIIEEELVRKLFETDEDIVADAGCLAHIANNHQFLQRKEGHTILTPHAGELKRLLDNFGLKSELELATQYNCYVVVKGQFTRIINPQGESCISSTGCSTLATAGSGDVLSGIIGAFVSCFDDFQAGIEAAVVVHGLCGESISTGIRGAIADDFVESIPQILKQLSPFN